MNAEDYCWAQHGLERSTSAALDIGQPEAPWQLAYEQDPPHCDVTHGSGSSTSLDSIRLHCPCSSVGSSHEPGSTSLPAMQWLPGITHSGLPRSMLHTPTSPTSPSDESPLLCDKRRMQNREAQRRFRKRREDQAKHLHERIASLEARCSVLNETTGQKSEQVLELLREKDALEAEVKLLRKQEQILVRLLQYSNGVLLQSFVPRVADVATPPLSPAAAASSQIDIRATVDAVLRSPK